MRVKILRQKWNKYIRSNQNIAAIMVALLAFLIIYLVMFQNPRPGVMDYGEYTSTLNEVGLNWTGSDLEDKNELQFTKIIEKYEIEKIPVERLLQIEPSQTLVYPVSIISIICKIFNTNFSTEYLAMFLAFIIILCMYSITKSLYCFFKQFSAVIGGIVCVVLLCGNHLIYLNSLYCDGIFLVSLLFYITSLLEIISNDRKRGIMPMLQILLATLFLLNSQGSNVFFLPIVCAINIFMFFYCKPEISKLIKYTLVCIVMFVFVISSNLRYSLHDESTFSNNVLYHAYFTGVLPSAEKPQEILKETGLPPELIADIGKSIYLSESDYFIAPSSLEAKERIFSKLTYQSLFATYRNHPDIFFNVLDKTAQNALKINTSKFLYNNRKASDGTEWVERFVVWQWIRNLIVPGSLIGYLLLFLSFGIIIGGYLYINRKNKTRLALSIVIIAILLIAIIEYLTTCTISGFAEVQSIIHLFIITTDFIYIVLISFVIYALKQGIEFLQIQSREKKEEESYDRLIESQENINSSNPLWDYFKLYTARAFTCVREKMKVFAVIKPRITASLFAFVAGIVILLVVFLPTRIGAYNNGDFGRMMQAMNLQYTAKDWANQAELSLTKIVENYDWVSNYDYTKIMFYNADLTQAWMSQVIKQLDNFTGNLQFSTIYVAIIYMLLLILSFYIIIKFMLKRYGYKWLWMGVILIFVLFDRSNLGWLNSLYGEGPAFVGLMMVIASSLYVIDLKRGTCNWKFIFLLFSVNFLAGCKAQYTVFLPVLLIWTLVLAIYHTPPKIWKAFIYYVAMIICCTGISATALNIYNNNQDISAPDTIYQSIFYGILMISDNPQKDLIELGLDPAMAVDAGKNAYLDKSEYYCAPRTDKAEKMLYSKVSSVDVLKFYLKHPGKLWTMLDVAAEAGSKLMPDYFIYVGDKTTEEHRTVNRFRAWENFRPYITANRFWELLVIYGILAVASIRALFKKRYSAKDKLLLGIYLVIALIGIIQFPLTVIGNGFADNTKQLYLFRVTYDIVTIIGAFFIVAKVKVLLNKCTEKLIMKENRKKVNFIEVKTQEDITQDENFIEGNIEEGNIKEAKIKEVKIIEVKIIEAKTIAANIKEQGELQ